MGLLPVHPDTNPHLQWHRQIGRRFGDLHPTHRVDEHVLIEAHHAGVPVQHRQQHRQTLRIEADGQPARIAMRLIDQGLDPALLVTRVVGRQEAARLMQEPSGALGPGIVVLDPGQG